jgi:hypothetical protein
VRVEDCTALGFSGEGRCIEPAAIGEPCREHAAMTTLKPVSKPPMVMRSHRYPKKLYEAAMKLAAEREENLSDVLREALERYVKKGGRR